MPIPIERLAAVQTIITHADCPDGIASAAILNHVLPKVPIRYLRYGTKEHEQLEPLPGMLFCDFSPPRARAPEFLAMGAIVLDHHKSASEIVKLFEEAGLGVFADEDEESGVCGALLAFRHVWRPLTKVTNVVNNAHLIDRKVEDFATLAGIRDTWQKTSPRWREACEQAEVMRIYGEYFVRGEMLHNHVHGRGGDIIELGKILFERTESEANRLAAQAIVYLVKFSSSKTAKVAILPSTFISDAADYVNDVDLIAGFRYSLDVDSLNLNVSLRARHGSGNDCGAIAKKFGGGGHRGAAGFTAAQLKPKHTNPYDLIVTMLECV